MELAGCIATSLLCECQHPSISAPQLEIIQLFKGLIISLKACMIKAILEWKEIKGGNYKDAGVDFNMT